MGHGEPVVNDLSAGGHDFEEDPSSSLRLRCRRCGKQAIVGVWTAVGHPPWPAAHMCPATASAFASVQKSVDFTGWLPSEPSRPSACECGARVAVGAARGAPGHSPWCPWCRP